MDYTTQSLGFRIRKTLRYFGLYGPRRTLMKVRGQYHMKKQYDSLPAVTNPPPTGGRIGLFGCGNYAFSNIAYYVTKSAPGALRGAMDIDINRAASLRETYGLRYYTDQPARIVEDEQIDLVFIASNHASHAEYAIDCIRAGKHVHIEKPHVVTMDQLERLCVAMHERPDAKVFLGFNRPRSRLFRELQTHLTKQSGPLMINWFIAGHEIADDHWYFDPQEGGRVLGNLCHWTDLTLHLVSFENAFPCRITPTVPENAKSDFIVSVVFADRSCATITFSAKGHTFEGVREVLNIHKGDILANLTDFERLSVDNIDARHRKRQIFRDHGHQANIANTLKVLEDSQTAGESLDYVRATAMFFLAIKDAIESGGTVDLSREAAFGQAPVVAAQTSA